MQFSLKFIDLSIVSHSQGGLVVDALKELALSSGLKARELRVWLTINIPEPSFTKQIQQAYWPFDLRIIQNPKPLGFGANHNQAFAHAQVSGAAKWFCVMNPDVLWRADTDAFWADLQNDVFDPKVGLVCPKQVDENGAVQDFTRPLPTPWGLLARTVRRIGGGAALVRPLPIHQADWANGACMVWRAGVFAALGGFDERYFMYCEDTDIGLRMRLAGFRMEQGAVTVVHLAQRNTGKSWRHLAWHLRSLLHLWLSEAFWHYVLQLKINPKFRSKKIERLR